MLITCEVSCKLLDVVFKFLCNLDLIHFSLNSCFFPSWILRSSQTNLFFAAVESLLLAFLCGFFFFLSCLKPSSPVFMDTPFTLGPVESCLLRSLSDHNLEGSIHFFFCVGLFFFLAYARLDFNISFFFFF